MTGNRRLGVVEIQDTCSAPGCDGLVVAVLPVLDNEHGPGVYWCCHQHAVALLRVFEKDPSATLPRTLRRTCGAGHPLPCGAAATHMEIVDVRGEHGHRGVAAGSVCRRHAGLNNEEE